MDKFSTFTFEDLFEPSSSRGNGADQWSEPRFRLVPWDEIKLGTQRRYLVKGIIPRVGLTVIWGPPKCGKSFWTFDALMHVALGREYRGRRIHQGPVVYCAFEGQEGFKARKEAFCQRFLQNNSEPVPFYLLPATLDLVADHRELIAIIRSTLGEVSPCAVSLDTLNRSLRGSESSDEDMGAYIKAADAIRCEFECAVPIVHHCGVDGSRPRGHTSLTGAVEAQIAVKRDAAGNVTSTVEWMKDGAEDATIVSRLEPVGVGIDEDGEPITSCVVVPSDGTTLEKPTRKLSDRQRLALNALTECTIDRGKEPPAEFGLPAGISAVAVDQWRDELFARGVLDVDAGNPREDFRRMRQSLAARGLIGERKGYIWKVHER